MPPPTLPSPVCMPRASLDAAQQAGIDRVLKDLKSCTRKLQAAFASYHVELQVLERLYYKGNNQHRHALFWRRVADVRRFGKRLESVQIHENIETLRLAFWGDASQQSAKTLKAAWTHVPDVNSVRHVLDRLRDSLPLLDSMEEHLAKAYNHLNLDLQTGAFLQLILTLTAITSRMAFLLTEIGPAVAQAWAACYRLLENLTPGPIQPMPRFLTGRYRDLDPRRIATPPAASRSVSRPAPDIEEGVDGVPVARPPTATAIGTSAAVADSVTVTGPGSDMIMEEETVTVSEDLSLLFVQPQEPFVPKTIVRETVERKVAKTKEPGEGSGRKRSAGAAAPGTEEAKSKKKRKKKDEIDDIFGF
ncbi:hypothetical protein PsYK624_032890 [Phanerochaete sordida]|uniref:Nucleolus and neural progenitor protein-like N-terminal domain-containing protein n=1 Tax=Phanerochaete sordida TaxID=48140 RepID=A0A9P3L9F3_9APHY|nr:hypothetical protein PsYK624_032890 [Phanerochaete sordida]